MKCTCGVDCNNLKTYPVTEVCPVCGAIYRVDCVKAGNGFRDSVSQLHGPPSSVSTLASMLSGVLTKPPCEIRKSGIKAYLQQIGQRDAAGVIR